MLAIFGKINTAWLDCKLKQNMARSSYLLVPKRIFDGILEQEKWLLPRSIKPVLVVESDFDVMWKHVQCIMKDSPPSQIYLLDCYEEFLFSGLTGTVLRPKHWNKFELVENFMTRANQQYVNFDTHFPDSKCRLVICPVLPVNILRVNNRNEPIEEDMAEQAMLDDVVETINGRLIQLNDRLGLNTPRIDRELLWIRQNTGNDGLTPDGDGLELENSVFERINRCLTVTTQD